MTRLTVHAPVLIVLHVLLHSCVSSNVLSHDWAIIQKCYCLTWNENFHLSLHNENNAPDSAEHMVEHRLITKKDGCKVTAFHVDQWKNLLLHAK